MSQPGTILNLASGGTVRVTPYLLEIRPRNSPAIPIDMHHVSGGMRQGTTVTINRHAAGSMQLEMASIDDAGQLETALRSALTQLRAAPPTYAAPPWQQTRDIPKKFVYGVVAVVVGVLIVAALFGGGDDSPSSGAAARRATSTPRAAVTSSQSQASSRYADRIATQSGELGDSFRRFGELMGDPQIGNDNWTVQVAVEIAIWRDAYAQAKTWTPPSEYRAAHTKYLEALRTFDDATYDIAYGIDNLDIAKINTANQKIRDGNALLNQATRLMPN